MAWAQIIATRLRPVEAVFGAMDKSYVIHKWLGIAALVLMYLHDTIGAEIKGISPETWLTDLGEGMGEFSLNGITVLVAITLALFIPYHLWRWTHRLIGVFFVLAVLHFAFIAKPMDNTSPIGLYTLGFGLLGTLAYIYAALPLKYQRKYSYAVSRIAQTGGATAITLAPQDKPMKHRAGQFAFFEIDAKGMGEPHPFTLSSAPHPDGTLRFTAKALGDYTRKLPDQLSIGTPISVQGPFGRFGTARTKRPQIWIAAGIGITPMVALLESWDETKPAVNLFYCFRGKANAAHLDELSDMAQALPNVTLHAIDSAQGNRLSGQAIATEFGAELSKQSVLYCGPAGLRNALKAELKDAGLSARHFHYEEFEIRTDFWPISLINQKITPLIPQSVIWLLSR